MSDEHATLAGIAELLRYFYRRTLRAHELHRPALFECADRTLQPAE